MSISKTVVLVLVALVCAALLALPVSAAPPQHRVTGGGWGVTGNDVGTDTDVAGDTVHFTCAAVQDADGAWRGEGTFRGHLDGAPVAIRLDIDDGTVHTSSAVYRDAYLYGDAEVSYLGGTSTRPFCLMLLQDATGKPNNILVAALLLGDDQVAGDFRWWLLSPGYGGPVLGGAVNID
jgi:hypothetical protein